jgi:cytochrome c553
MFRPAIRRLFGIAALAGIGMPPAALAVDAAAIAHAGNGRGAAPCMACHGADGAGQAAAGNPRLAGLDAAYLQNQQDHIASGAPSNPEMQPTANALSEDERHAMATYYSQLPLAAKPATALPAPDSAGAVLATRGDWSRGVPGCVQCHGPGGSGVGANFPPLAGQPASYIEAQLKAWQQGTRHNDPLQLMQHLSAALGAQDIEAVAAWFAAQPVPAAETAP